MLVIDNFKLQLGPSNNEGHVKIYEKFFEIMSLGKNDNSYATFDLGVLPKQQWYNELKILIETFGIENYRSYAIKMLEDVIRLQAAHLQLDRLMLNDSRKGIRKHATEYISDYNDMDKWMKNFSYAPTHYYFYGSEKGRYLKGLILSIVCIPDPILLKLIEKFALECPFQVAGASQAPTGLYVYDVLEVFSTLNYPNSIPYILNLKAKIKQTWAQKKIDSYLNDIAKKSKIDLDKIIEFGMTDYGFNSEHVYEKEVGNHLLKISFPVWGEKEQYWYDLASGKKQKAIPKEIKEDHPEFLKYITNHIKDIELQLETQVKRIERLYLSGNSWSIDYWKEKYLDHPFIGIISKKIVWLLTKDTVTIPIIINGNSIIDLKGDLIDIEQFDIVSLWHPILSTKDEINSVKNVFQKINKTYVFKQIEREYYEVDFFDLMKGEKMSKAILSQLCKSKGWTSTTHMLAIPGLNITVKLLLNESEDGTRSVFGGSEHVDFVGIEIQRNKKEIAIASLNDVVVSEIARDVDLFISKAGEK